MWHFFPEVGVQGFRSARGSSSQNPVPVTFGPPPSRPWPHPEEETPWATIILEGKEGRNEKAQRQSS